VATIGKQVLVLSPTESVRRTRELLLSEAGYAVVSVTGPRDLEFVCRRSRFDLAIIGDAYEPEQKRRFAEIIRHHGPGTPLLEICRISPVIHAPESVLYSSDPTELLGAVAQAFSPAQKIAPGDPASRDDAPRLVSFKSGDTDQGFAARYLELADQVLGTKARKKGVGR
jgi:CheY-like chemotaxis protein